MGFRSSCPLHVCSFVQHSRHLFHANYLKISYPSKLVQLSIIVFRAIKTCAIINYCIQGYGSNFRNEPHELLRH